MYIWIIAAIVFLLDRITKLLVVAHMDINESFPVLGHFFYLTYVQNRGAAFGLFAGKTPYIIVLTLIGLAAVFFMRKRISRLNKGMAICIGLIIGGALGNFWDRLHWGYVVDFVDFRIWPFIFNIADSALVVGSIMLAVMLFRLEDAQKADPSNQESLLEETAGDGPAPEDPSTNEPILDELLTDKR